MFKSVEVVQNDLAIVQRLHTFAIATRKSRWTIVAFAGYAKDMFQ